MVGGYPALWARDTSTGELDLYTGSANITAGSPTSTKTVTAASGWTSAARPDLYSAGAANSGNANPDLWATDSQAVHNVSYYPAGSTTGSLGSGTRVQTLSPSDDFTGNGNAGMAADRISTFTSTPPGDCPPQHSPDPSRCATPRARSTRAFGKT